MQNKIINYEEFIEYIKEGLIRTHNIEKYESSLEIELNSHGIEYEINIISKYLFDLKILNLKELKKDNLFSILVLVRDLLGYYPSYIWVENDFGINGFPFEEKYLDVKYKTLKVR